MNLNLWCQLTHAEKVALELKHDFGLTDQHVKDIIAARSHVTSTTPERLRACIRSELEYLPWVREQRARATSDAMRKVWDQKIACIQTHVHELDTQIADIEAELEHPRRDYAAAAE